MIVRKEDKIEIYEDKNKSKRYLVLLIITLVLLIINSIFTKDTSLIIEIAAYFLITLGIIVTIDKIRKPAKKVLEVDKEYLTIIYKREQEKVEINKIKNITAKMNMYIVNIEEGQDLPIFKKNLSLSIEELNGIINEYENK